MLVTCYYNLYKNQSKVTEYMRLFHKLGMNGIPIILFTEPELVQHFRIFPPSVKVIGMQPNDLEVYSRCMRYTGLLPKERN